MHKDSFYDYGELYIVLMEKHMLGREICRRWTKRGHYCFRSILWCNVLQMVYHFTLDGDGLMMTILVLNLVLL
jgi:hypothetical protein